MENEKIEAGINKRVVIWGWALILGLIGIVGTLLGAYINGLHERIRSNELQITEVKASLAAIRETKGADNVTLSYILKRLEELEKGRTVNEQSNITDRKDIIELQAEVRSLNRHK